MIVVVIVEVIIGVIIGVEKVEVGLELSVVRVVVAGYILNCLPACLLACLPACLLVCLPACLLVCLSACLLACVETYMYIDLPGGDRQVIPQVLQMLVLGISIGTQTHFPAICISEVMRYH